MRAMGAAWPASWQPLVVSRTQRAAKSTHLSQIPFNRTVSASQAPGLVKPMKGDSPVCLLGEGRFKQRDGAKAEGGGLRT